MDLERWITEPPEGVLESDAPRPIVESVQSVLDDSYQEGGVSDAVQEVLDLLLEVLPSARNDFHVPPSEQYLDDLIEPLIDASVLTGEEYERSIDSIRREFASSIMRSFVRHFGNIVGLDYVPPGGQTSGFVRSAFMDFVRLVRDSFDRIGSEALKGVVYEFVSVGYRSLYRAWIGLEREFAELPEDPRERELESLVRELESSVSASCARAYDFGRELRRRSRRDADQMLGLVDRLIQFLEATLRGVDLYAGLVAVRIRVGFKRWESVVVSQLSDLVRREIGDVMSVLGVSVLHPIMSAVVSFRNEMDSLQRLVGELPQLESLDRAFELVGEWQRRYYDYIESLRGGVRATAEVSFRVSSDTVQYARLWRRRRLFVMYLRLLRSLRDGLSGGQF